MSRTGAHALPSSAHSGKSFYTETSNTCLWSPVLYTNSKVICKFQAANLTTVSTLVPSRKYLHSCLALLQTKLHFENTWIQGLLRPCTNL